MVKAVCIVVGESPHSGCVDLLVIPEVGVLLRAEWDVGKVGVGVVSLSGGEGASGVGELIWNWKTRIILVKVGFRGFGGEWLERDQAVG